MEIHVTQQSISPPSNEYRLQALEQIRTEVGEMFHHDTEFCSSSEDQTLLLDWPMHDQPLHRAGRSRTIAIRFSAPWLDAYVTSGFERRIEFLSLIWAAVRARMRVYERGREQVEEDKRGVTSFGISLRFA